MPETRSAQDEVMPLAQAKRMLAMAKGDPLGCAFGLTKDKKECMLLIEKVGSGKKLAAKLRTEGQTLGLDPVTVRFGTVGFQLPDDPGTVRFTVNKSEAGGTIINLNRFAKKAGYQGIVINVDPGLDESAAEQEPGSVAPPPPPPSQQPNPGPAATDLAAELATLIRRIPEAAGTDQELKARLAKTATDTNVNLKTGNLATAADRLAELRDGIQGALDAATQAASATEPAQSSAQLAAQLGALMRRIAAVGADQRAPLVQLASQANASLKANDPAKAAPLITQLHQALDAPAPGPALSPVKLGKAALVWRGMWAKADRDLQALNDAVTKAMLEDDDVDPDDYDEIEGNLRRVAGITNRLNLSLADELDDLLNTEPGKIAGSRAKIAKRLDEYEDFLATDRLVALLADNEFHPVAVKEDLLKAVTAMRSAIAGP